MVLISVAINLRENVFQINIEKDKFVFFVIIYNRFCSKTFYMKSFRSFLSRRSFGEEQFFEKRKLTKSFTVTGVGTISLRAISE